MDSLSVVLKTDKLTSTGYTSLLNKIFSKEIFFPWCCYKKITSRFFCHCWYWKKEARRRCVFSPTTKAELIGDLKKKPHYSCWSKDATTATCFPFFYWLQSPHCSKYIKAGARMRRSFCVLVSFASPGLKPVKNHLESQ